MASRISCSGFFKTANKLRCVFGSLCHSPSYSFFITYKTNTWPEGTGAAIDISFAAAAWNDFQLMVFLWPLHISSWSVSSLLSIIDKRLGAITINDHCSAQQIIPFWLWNGIRSLDTFTWCTRQTLCYLIFIAEGLHQNWSDVTVSYKKTLLLKFLFVQHDIRFIYITIAVTWSSYGKRPHKEVD